MRRHLTPGGAAVFHVPSSVTHPHAFDSAWASAEAAGFTLRSYEAPVPLQGALSFLVGSTASSWEPSAADLPRGLCFLDAAALSRALALGAKAPRSHAAPDTLNELRSVELWNRDQDALGK